ncbi:MULTISPECIES: UDP-glucose/GDP-mannose dehydrogenase family protein [unclassified Campylobacter]|uniref:UDP-glucose dehydrogenase family protein n=1 Tax=unclassified Campylobacter TaxID=2593542 RepID=UPI001BDB2E32|nr:UDP-glucose/GDP-mannose dehydrogenase family protein [Campylobacter sp. 2018MI27]MBT0885142.1 UDP-glucose/GDP-mannose dehydrogenase family protein [Campylobacter sp. 2018MI10]
MNIVIIGTGYVGLPSGVGFAQLGHNVTCVDIDVDKINILRQGNIPIFENDLEIAFREVVNSRLFFTTSYSCINNADIVILAVGTPQLNNSGSVDLRYIDDAIIEIAKNLCKDKNLVLAIKSTVPVGTSDQIEHKFNTFNLNVNIVSLPEFLREGYALVDFYNPDRVIIGSNSDKASKVLKELYSHIDSSKILITSRKSAELIKYASNSFLAMKIHFINEMADFCEKSGANINEVALGIGFDSRIGDKFLNPGPGYGGSCFPKDTLAMLGMAKELGVGVSLIETIIKGNNDRFKKIANNIKDMLKDIDNPKIGILGLAFKNGTDDCRQSPAIEIIKEFIKNYQNINVYDPRAINNAKGILNDNVNYTNSIYECANECDLLVILTEWDEFKDIDFLKLKDYIKVKKIYDTRNIINFNEAKKYGFDVINIGVKN